MLRNFRSVFKGSQFPMTIVMGVVLLSLVAYLGTSGSQAGAPETAVARVYGRSVLNRDLNNALNEALKQSRRGSTSDQQREALQGLIDQKLMEELAERRNVVVTDEETRIALELQLKRIGFVDQKGNLMSTQEITDLIKERGITLKQMEDEIRHQISIQKLIEGAAAQIPVDEIWLNAENRIHNEKISFESWTVAPEPGAVADPGDAKLGEFLKASGARFQVGLRRVLQYVIVEPDEKTKGQPVDEDTLRKAYASRLLDFTTEMKSSHILFSAKGERDYQQAYAKAKALREKLIAGQDFSQTAFEISEDPSAKGESGNKGSMGWHVRGKMVRPYEEAILTIKDGEISQPVRTPFGVHLIRREGWKGQNFEDVKGVLQVKVEQDRFATKAKDKLEQLRKRAGENGDLATAARNLGLKAELGLPFLVDGSETIPGKPESRAFAWDAFKEMKIGQVSSVKPLGKGFVLYRVQEERPSTIPPLNEIRSKVLETWKMEEARRTAQEKVKVALVSGDLKTLGAPAVSDKVTIQSQGNLVQHPSIRKALLDTAVDQITPALWDREGKLWVARIKERIPAEPLSFEKRRALIRQIQNSAAIMSLQAELQDMKIKGEKRSGFSSLYGHLNGIWIDEDYLKSTKTEAPDRE